MRVKKFQGGGFATFTPIVNTMPTSTSSSKTEADTTKASTSILNDDVFKELLKGDFLVNDANNLVKELIALEAGSPTPYTQANTRSMALKMIGKINELKQNKNYWQDAINRAKENGGLGEVAVGTSGEVYTKDENNNIQAISLSQYSKQKDQVKLLSVAELMNERQYNPNLIGRNSLFNVAENAIGLDKISGSIKDIVSMLGKETLKTEDYYTKDQAKKYLAEMGGKEPTSAEMEGISLLNKIINNPGELAQVQSEESSERKHLDKALNYIWDTLGTNKQQKLMATSVMNGRKNPKELIFDMLVFGTDESKSMSVTPKAESSVAGSSSKQPKQISLSPQELFHNDRLYKPGTTYDFNSVNAKTIMKATATAVGPLFSLNKSGATIGQTIVTDILENGNYRSIVDPNKAFIGDTKVNPTLLSELAYTGADVSKVYMPVNADGSPNLAQMDKFNKAYEVFNANKDRMSIPDLQDFFKRSGFNNVHIKEIPTSDGKFTKVIAENGSVRPFLALPVITNSASDLSDNVWMNEIQGDAKEEAEKIMNQAFTVVGGTSSKPKYINKMPSKWNALETPYTGSLFIAYRPESSAIISSMMGHIGGTQATELDISRNLRAGSGSANPAGVQASAQVLINN